MLSGTNEVTRAFIKSLGDISAIEGVKVRAQPKLIPSSSRRFIFSLRVIRR
jgi:hypothetical protein